MDELLPRAIQGQHLEIVKLILEREANVNLVAAEGGLSPLELAVSRNSPQIVQLLLEKGAKANENGSGDAALLAITSKAQANWQEYVSEASPGLEQVWRANMQEQHQKLVQVLLDSCA